MVLAAYPGLHGNEPFPASKGFHPCLALLPMGVTWPCALLHAPVVSYTTFSPSLDLSSSPFLWSFPRVAPSGCYPASCSVERGLSSDSSVLPAITRSAHFPLRSYLPHDVQSRHLSQAQSHLRTYKFTTVYYLPPTAIQKGILFTPLIGKKQSC